MLTVDTTIGKFHEQVGEIMTKELLEVRLIDKNDIKNQVKSPAYKNIHTWDISSSWIRYKTTVY